MEVSLAFLISYNKFCRYSVSRKSWCVSLAPKLWLLQRSRNEIILFSPKRLSSGLPIEFFYVIAGFQWSSYCVKTVEVHHIIINFVDTQFRENISVFLWHQNYGVCRDREMKIILFPPKRRSSGLPIEFFCVTAGFQGSSYFVKTVEVRHIILNFVDTQFRENISVFLWHQNYGFCRNREMKIILFYPKRRSSGLPIEFFCVTAGFRRSSHCVKTVEVHHIIVNFVDTQFRENLSVFPWHQYYGLCRDRKMKLILFFFKTTVLRASY